MHRTTSGNTVITPQFFYLPCIPCIPWFISFLRCTIQEKENHEFHGSHECPAIQKPLLEIRVIREIRGSQLFGRFAAESSCVRGTPRPPPTPTPGSAKIVSENL